MRDSSGWRLTYSSKCPNRMEFERKERIVWDRGNRQCSRERRSMNSRLFMPQSFRVAAIPTKIAELVRSTMRSPGYGHPVHVEVATGYGPCRHCLRDFQVGRDRRILFTYDPFHGIERLPLPGPIFIHKDSCERFPEAAGFPADLRSHRLTVVAYGDGRRLIAEEYVDNGEVEPLIARLLQQVEVKYLHVRDTEAGCYDLRIERE